MTGPGLRVLLLLRHVALAALFMPAALAQAEVALVRGGEHPDFTRIVIEADGPSDWRFGRTIDGYELDLAGGVTGYDLSVAFDKIPRDRISGLWRDPDSGRLRIALSCPCHAVAFEFRPGIVVVDVKTGAPPAGSSFELPIEGAKAGEAAGPRPGEAGSRTEDSDQAAPANQGVDPAAPTYDWIRIARSSGQEGAGPEMTAIEMAADLAPLQAAMLEQISRGAAEGVVGIAEHPKLPDVPQVGMSEADGLRVSVGELPGLVIGDPSEDGSGLAADGTSCVPDEQLQIQAWGLPGSVAEQLGPGRSGMLTEFDAPVAPAIQRAARAYLSLGFGAEARQFLDLLDDPADPAAALLRAMSHVVDAESPPVNVFAGMQSCDGAAALWAMMAAVVARPEAATTLRDLDAEAVARTFSGLAPHQRRLFGPALVDAFLARGDQESARRIRDSIQRAPGEGGADTALMEARYDLATGNAEAAARTADDVFEEAGPLTAEAAVTLVEAAFVGASALPADVPDKIESLVRENGGTGLEAPLHRALVLGRALSGDFDRAFADLAAAPGTSADLWSIAVSGAEDALFFEQAVAAARSGALATLAMPPDTGFLVAERLMTLGFAAEALVWLGSIRAGDEPKRRLLGARAHLALGDARSALAAVSGLGDAEAERLRAEAVLRMGDPAAAADAWGRAGDAEAEDRARVWTRDWPALAEDGPDRWAAVAALVAEGVAQEGDPSSQSEPPAQTAGQEGGLTLSEGPLARGTALVEESAAAREAIEGLLLTIATSPDQ